jgi:predicted phage terminase large subunit-like protein
MVEVSISDEQLKQYRDSIQWESFPAQHKALYEAWSEDDKKQWLRARYSCLKSLLYLGGFYEKPKTGDSQLCPEIVPILGMDFQVEPHGVLFEQFLQMRPGEGIALTDLEPSVRKKMILWPRNVFKTSAVIVAIIQAILNYPDIRIAFLTGGDELAKRQLARVKSFFENPKPMFAKLFPEYCFISVFDKKEKKYKDVNAKLGNAHEFTVPCRLSQSFAEPTFAITTAKSVKSGAHFDILFIDDLVNDQNYRSVTALETCYQNYLNCIPLIDIETGILILTGTRYSFGDTYERIKELAEKEMKESGRSVWQFSIRNCWNYACMHCGHSELYHDYSINISQPPCRHADCIGFERDESSKGVLFPQVRLTYGDKRLIGTTVEGLEATRREVGREFFANQWENNPLAMESQTFPEALINARTYFESSRTPQYQNSFTFAVGDLAYVGQAGRDFSVIYLCRMFLGQIFVYHCLFGNWNSEQVAEATYEVLTKHRPAALYYEKFNGSDAYNNVIMAYAQSHGIQKVPLQWLKGSQADKAKMARIGAVQGVLAAGRLFLLGSMPGYADLVNQLTKWPKLGRHDDFADCLGMVVAAPTGYQLTTPPSDVASQNWLHRLHGTAPATEEDTRMAGSFDPNDPNDTWK